MLILVSLSYPGPAGLIVPHAPRLVGLAARMKDSRFCFSQIPAHLRYSLHTFRAPTDTHQQHMVVFPTSPWFWRRFIYAFKETES